MCARGRKLSDWLRGESAAFRFMCLLFRELVLLADLGLYLGCFLVFSF